MTEQTEKEKQAEEKLARTKEYWSGFPEAPVSDSCKWIDPQGFEHLSTLRAWSPENLLSQFARFQAAILALDGRPINNQPKTAPVPQVQEHDETGLPVVDAEGQPVMQPAPGGTKEYTVKALFHDKTKSGKDVLKVVTEEAPYNTKYGASCWHGGPEGWKSWAEGVENKYLPPKGFGHVLIRDPEKEGGYPEVGQFKD